MAHNPLTVTNPNPTPPTNLINTGATPPNPPQYDPLCYVDYQPDTDFDTNPPPFYDDGIPTPVPNSRDLGTVVQGSWNEPSGSRIVFAAKKAALAYGGPVASTSVDHEGLGTEVAVTQTYTTGTPGDVDAPIGTNAGVPLIMVSCLGNYTNTPNASHASCLSNAITSTIGSLTAGGVNGIGVTPLTVTGTNFNRSSYVTVSGVPQTTNYVSATSLTVANAPKKSGGAGNLPVTVVTNGYPTAPTNWVFT
jgi:hypothetical protein